MSIELSLIRRIIDTQAIKEVVEYGITELDFTEAQSKTAWRVVLGWFRDPRTEGSTISLSIFQYQFAGMPIRDEYPGETLRSLCFMVRTSRIRQEASQIVIDLMAASQAMNAPMTEAMETAQGRLGQLIALGQVANCDMDTRTGLMRQVQRIRDRMAGINHSVAPWPWEVLQGATLGILPDDYIVFYGRPKNMKTWVLSFLLTWLFECDIMTVVYTKEMTPDNLYQRFAACLLRQSYQSFRLGMVDVEQMAFLNQQIEQMARDPLFSQKLIVLSGRDVPAGADTVSWFKSKLEKYKPKNGAPMVGLVDGLYLLSGSAGGKQKDNERVQSISRGLRGIPLDIGVPIIATNQANRAAAKNSDANLDEMAFSDALAQDATLAARLIADKTGRTVSVVIGGSREFDLKGFRINALPAVDFSFHSLLTDEDIQKAKEEDLDSDGKPKKAKKKKDETLKTVNEAKEMAERVKEAAAREPQLPS